MSSSRGAAGILLAILVAPVFVTLAVVMVLDGGSVEAWFEIVAWISVGTILVTLWLLRSYLRYRATDADARRQLRELRPQLLAGTSVTVRIRQGFDRDDAIERLRAGFDRDESLEENDATIRDVAAGLASAVGSARPSWVPVLAWRGILEGVLLAGVGMIAFAPLAYWRAAVDPTPSISAGGAVSAIEVGLELGTTAIASYPFAGLVFALVLSTGILAITGIWGSWLVPAAVLVAGGIALSWLHLAISRRDAVPDDVRIGRSRARASLRILGWLALLWAVGVAWAVGGRLLDGHTPVPTPLIGDVLGIVSSIVLTTVGVVWWIRRTTDRINEVGETHPAETTAVVVYLVLRRVYLGVAIVGAVLVVGYLGQSIVSGRLLEVLGVLASAPTWVLTLLGLAGLSVVVIAALQIPSVLEDLRDLGSRITRSTALRLWLFARGVPIVGTVAAFAFTLALFASLFAAGAAAVVTGVLLRLVGAAIVRAKYAALRRYGGLERPVKEVHVAPFRVEDADGEPIWVADVDGERLAHRDRELLLEDVLDLVRERTETGQSAATESAHYYGRVEDGYVDLERLRTKLRSETRLEARVVVRESGGEVDDSAARERLERDYPEWVVDDELAELRRRGILDLRNGRLVLRDAPDESGYL